MVTRYESVDGKLLRTLSHNFKGGRLVSTIFEMELDDSKSVIKGIFEGSIPDVYFGRRIKYFTCFETTWLGQKRNEYHVLTLIERDDVFPRVPLSISSESC